MKKKPTFNLIISDGEGNTTDESHNSSKAMEVVEALKNQEYNFSLTPEQESQKKEENIRIANSLCNEILSLREDEYLPLFNQKIKADILKIILDNINGRAPENMTKLLLGENCALSLKNIVEDAFLKAKIGEVKYRDFIKVENKNIGVSQGAFVVKAKDNIADPSLKYKYKWIKKTSSNSTKNIGEEICEYVGTNIMNYLLEDNSPKVRLFKDQKNNVSLGVKFLNNFKTYDSCSRAEISDIEEKIENGSLKGLARFYLANMILGDYDNNPGNFGFITNDKGEISIARIDHGKIFSYKSIKKESDEAMMQTVFNMGAKFEDFIKERYNHDYNLNNIEQKIFRNPFFKNNNMFKGDRFNQELDDLIKEINVNFISKIIDRSIGNIKEAYGADIFLNTKVQETLSERLMIDKSTINEETFKTALLDNIDIIGQKIQQRTKEYLLIEDVIETPKSWSSSISAEKRNYKGNSRF